MMLKSAPLMVCTRVSHLSTECTLFLVAPPRHALEAPGRVPIHFIWNSCPLTCLPGNAGSFVQVCFHDKPFSTFASTLGARPLMFTALFQCISQGDGCKALNPSSYRGKSRSCSLLCPPTQVLVDHQSSINIC